MLFDTKANREQEEQYRLDHFFDLYRQFRERAMAEGFIDVEDLNRLFTDFCLLQVNANQETLARYTLNSRNYR